MLNHCVQTDNFDVDDISNDILRDIYQYWIVMKGDSSMPSRADLNPCDIVSLLPYVSLIDVEHQTQRYRMRLVGTEIVRAFDKDITGKYLDELPKMEHYLKARYEWIVREKQPYFITDELHWSSKSFLNFCSVGMPLSNDGRDVHMILFGTYFEAPDDQ